jgi:hypothetical protein
MASKPIEEQGFDAESRKAVKAAYEALSEWRDDVAAAMERHADSVVDKMAAAAERIGWPDNLVEATSQQLRQGARIQLHLMDRVLGMWQSQLKSGTPFAIPSHVLPPVQAFPGALPQPGPHRDMGSVPMTPLHFWMQAAELWQQSWVSAFEMWTGDPTRRR